MSCGVGLRRSSDNVLLWRRCGPAAIAQICPLSWELPCALGAALKKKKKKKKEFTAKVLQECYILEIFHNKIFTVLKTKKKVNSHKAVFWSAGNVLS